MRFGFGTALSMLVLCTVPALAAMTTYRCTDRTGTSIFTDSPSQLENCTAVTLTVPSSAGSVVDTPRADMPISAPSRPEVQSTAENGQEAIHGSPPVDGQVTVPVQRAGRSLTVQAKLNGTHDARLIVDTGADITILSHKVALDLGITPTSSSPTVTLNTAGGSVRADIVRLSTLAVGGAEVRNVSVAVHTLPDAPPDVDGLLGLTFLDKFLVTLDAQKGELHLKKRE